LAPEKRVAGTGPAGGNAGFFHRRDKLLKIDAYFSLLKYFLRLKNTKVLIFDEKGVKEAFYRLYLDDDTLLEKIIFSKGRRCDKTSPCLLPTTSS
jgi:hypothetical protein